MKMKSLFITTIACFVFMQNVEAQFLKKLGDRVKQKVENTIVEKTANEAAEKTSKSMDKVFDSNPFGSGKKLMADPAAVASVYDFSWKYSLKMTTSSKEGEMFFDYYLEPDASYFGFASPTMANMFTVMDNGKKVIVMFMQSQGNKAGMVTSMPDDMDSEGSADELAKFTFQQLPEKTINGYHCKGVKATNNEMEMVMYFTNEAEVTFDDFFKNQNQQTKIPIQLKDYFKPGDKVLMISMDMKGLKDKKMDARIECVGLEKVSMTLKKSDYKFM